MIYKHVNALGLALVVSLLTIVPPAMAVGLLDKEIHGELETQFAGTFPVTDAVVDIEGVEFSRTFLEGNIVFDLDVGDDFFTITYTNNLSSNDSQCPGTNQSCSFNMGLNGIELSELPFNVVGLTLVSSTFPGFAISGSSFDGNSARVDFPQPSIPGFGTTWEATWQLEFQTQIDQVSEGLFDDSNLAIGGNSDQLLAQTVTTGLTGDLVGLNVPLACSGETPLTVEIRDVVDGRPGDTVIMSQTFGSGELLAGVFAQELSFSSPVFFAAGDQFAFVLSTDDGSCGMRRAGGDVVYNPGSGFFIADPNPRDRWVGLFGDNPDLLFETVVLVQAEEPVISYSPNPDLDEGSNPIEGDFVFFSCSESPGYDPEVDTCSWAADVPGLGEEGGSVTQEAEGQVVVFAFPQDGNVPVQLTITDGESNPQVANEIVTVDNGRPLINALDVEVMEGTQGEAICRFADPGVFDVHNVSFFLNGGANLIGSIDVQRENVPALSSGFGSQQFFVSAQAGAQISGTCIVDDSDGNGIASQTFTISVVSAEELQAREVEDPDSSTGAPQILAGREVLGVLDSPDDIDVFELLVAGEDLPDQPPSPDGLEIGGEFVVSLTVPTDYDLIILSTSTSGDAESSPFVNVPFVNVPFVNVPFVNVPFVNVPFVNVPFVNVPFVNVPFVNVPFVNVPFVNAPFVNVPLSSSPFAAAGFKFTDFPLSQVGLAAPDGGNISGIDVGLDELGSANLGALLNENLQVQMFSAESGDQPEKVLVRVNPGVERLFAAVVSNSGSVATAPYSLRVEASSPPSQEQLIGAQCIREPFIDDPNVATTSPVVLHSPSGAPTTLILTQRERLMKSNGIQSVDEFGADFLDDMREYFDHPLVNALVISVPSVWFDDADRNQCDISLQTALSRQILTDIIDEELNGQTLDSIMLMGGPDIIPPWYTPDETTVGYEGLYASDLLMEPGRPIAVAFAEGNNITDAPYGDLDPLSWRGRELYLEDIPVARLVETTDEILAAAQRFVADDGIININGALTTGYDFFIDGAEETAAVIATIVEAPNVLDLLISDEWSGADLRCSYLNVSDGIQMCPVEPSLAVVNLHASYNAGLSAAGFVDFPANANISEVVQANETPFGRLGGLTLSLGCHSGLSVPDSWALPNNVGLPLDPAQDWVQQPGNWIGAWNYALGDNTVADRGTEGIITLVAEKLAEGLPLGQALVQAKRDYATGLFEFDVHDEKSLIGLALFGMPQARLNVPANRPEPIFPLPGVPDPSGEALVLEVSDPSSPIGQPLLTVSPEYRLIDTDVPDGDQIGRYFALGRGAQAVVGRPLLPTVQPIRSAVVPRSQRLHDVVITGGTFTDLLDVDPVFAFPQHDWADTEEPQACVETFSPSQLGIATGVDIPGAGAPQSIESLIVIGAQFRCTTQGDQNAGTSSTGTLRKFTGLDVEAQRPTTGPADDFVPPMVTRQDLVVTTDPLDQDVTAMIDVSDNNDMHEVVVLIYDSPNVGDIASARFPLTNGPATLTIPGAKGKPLAFQYVDNSGNVLLKTGKGELLAPLAVEVLTTDIIAGTTDEVVVVVSDAENLDSPEVTIDFADGTFDTFSLFDAAGQPMPGVSVDADGDVTVRAQHTYDTLPSLQVTLAATAKADGNEGFAERVVDVCTSIAARARSSDVTLTWPHIGATSYNVYRSLVSGGPYNFLGNTTSTYSTFQDVTVTAGTTYFYVVNPVDTGGVEVCQTNETSATPQRRRRRR